MSALPPGLIEEEEPSAPFWMATFSDMMTLLLTFFVMLVAMSSVEVKKFEEALSYFTGRRGLMDQEGVMAGIMGIAGQQDTRERAESYEEIAHDLQQQGVAHSVTVDLTERGIRLTVLDSIAFAPGSVVLHDRAREVLARVAEVVPPAMSVEVEGHTDDVPIATATYPSNWELSAARAAAVVRFLSGEPGALPPDRYVAVGYGEFRPRVANDSPDHRALNRRVTVLFRDRPDAPSTASAPFPNSPTF